MHSAPSFPSSRLRDWDAGSCSSSEVRDRRSRCSLVRVARITKRLLSRLRVLRVARITKGYSQSSNASFCSHGWNHPRLGQCIKGICVRSVLVPRLLVCALAMQCSCTANFSPHCSGSTWLQLPWLYPAEINPLATRTNANAVSTINNWLFNFAIVMATPPLLTSISWGTFLLFGCLNVGFIPIIYVFYPETAGRTLEEIDVIFAKGNVEGRWYVQVAKEMPSLSPADIESEYQRLGLGEVPKHATDV